jgi:hypothetical protein
VTCEKFLTGAQKYAHVESGSYDACLHTTELAMAKGQKRSNRETKKPKQTKSASNAASPLALVAATRDSASGGGRDRAAPRNGRK